MPFRLGVMSVVVSGMLGCRLYPVIPLPEHLGTRILIFLALRQEVGVMVVTVFDVLGYRDKAVSRYPDP